MKALKGQWKRLRELEGLLAQRSGLSWPRFLGTGSSHDATKPQYATQNIPRYSGASRGSQQLEHRQSVGGQNGWGSFASSGYLSWGIVGLGGTAMMTYMNRSDFGDFTMDSLRSVRRSFTDFMKQDQQPMAMQLGNFLADAAAKASPAVVNITSKIEPQSSAVWSDKSCGSGFITDKSGVIITNAHVVESAVFHQQLSEGKWRERPLSVALQDGRIFEGKVLGIDRQSDLALVQIEATAPLPVVQIGSSKNMRVGEWVLALGSPLTLQNSVTAGIVSCTSRKAEELGLIGTNTSFIQTDAAINKGNSGGPLLNMAGEVIGISCMRALGSEGVSFAIPIDSALDVIQELKEGRRQAGRPYVGMKILELNPEIAHQMHKKNPKLPILSAGVLVPSISKGSPAEKAGLKPGDVITGVEDDKEAVTVASLMTAFSNSIGKKMKIFVRRDQQSLLLVLTPCEVNR